MLVLRPTNLAFGIKPAHSGDEKAISIAVCRVISLVSTRVSAGMERLYRLAGASCLLDFNPHIGGAGKNTVQTKQGDDKALICTPAGLS